MTMLAKDIIKNSIFWLLCLMLPICAQARKAPGTVVPALSDLPGADMTIYALYADARDADPAKAVEYANVFLSSIRQDLPLPELVEMEEYISNYYEKEAFLFSKAIEPRLKLDTYYHQLNDAKSRALNSYRLGVLYYQIDQYHKTLYYINAAYDFFRDQPLSPEKLDIYNLLGITYYMCQDYEHSNQCFSKYASGARELKDTLRLVKALANSTVYTTTVEENILKTESMVNAAMKLCRENRDTSDLFSLSTLLIDPYIQIGDYAYAEKLLESSAQYIRNIQDRGFYYIYKGVFAVNRGEDDQAIDYFLEAIANYDQGEFKYRIRECLSYLHPLFAKKKDYKSAYEVLMRFNYLDIGESGGTIYLDLFRYKNELILQSEKEKVLETQKNQMILLNVFIVLLILIVPGVVYFLRKKNASVRRREREFEEEKQQLETARQKIESKDEVLELRKIQQKQADKHIEDISDQLNRIAGKLRDRELKDELMELSSNLKMVKGSEGEDPVQNYVPEFNSDFYRNIIKAFPNLTVNERRLCVLLNKNLSTKEISQITMQSENTINIARGRLRNKLGLRGENVSIYEFLSRFE